MRVKHYLAEGLGDSSYLIFDEATRCAAVLDAQRDVWQYLDDAASLRATITHVFDTHVHNDFVSGSFALAELAGARVVVGKDAGLAYDHVAVGDGDAVPVGSLTMTAVHTPGHTREHMAYALSADSGEVRGLFTGGSLLVASAGRTDLLGPGETETLTRLQRSSLLRLAGFSDDVAVYPTHGEGSFCAVSGHEGERITTVGQERARNPALRVALAEHEDAFVRHQLRGLPAFPAYYAHMAPLNRRGTPPLGPNMPELRPLAPTDAHGLQQHGVIIVDARDPADFAKGHPRAATSIQLGDTFASYVGWILPFNADLVLVLAHARDARRATVQLIRIGFDRAHGYVDGGFEAWRRAGLPIHALEAIDVAAANRLLQNGKVMLLDVRQEAEWNAGHVPGAGHLPVGELPRRFGDVPTDKPLVTMCASGVRATMAASLITRFGIEVKPVLGGFDDWAAAGWPTASGS